MPRGEQGHETHLSWHAVTTTGPDGNPREELLVKQLWPNGVASLVVFTPPAVGDIEGSADMLHFCWRLGRMLNASVPGLVDWVPGSTSYPADGTEAEARAFVIDKLARSRADEARRREEEG